MAGALCLQYLSENYGVKIYSHIKSIQNVTDKPFEYTKDYSGITNTKCRNLEVFDKYAEEQMLNVIENAAKQGNSVGGTIECCALGVEAGLGSPMMQGIESRISALLFSIPAVKAVEFGAGFEICKMTGSEANDQIEYKDGKYITSTNNNGGILGGISNGMPIVFTAGIKPTPSIALPQQTATKEGKNIEYTIKGRHDSCIVPRVLPVIESVAAVVLLDLYMEKYGYAKY